MGYSKSAYIKAREIIEKRAQEANNTSVLRTAAIYKEIPEVKVIDEELANTALQIVKAIAQGKEGIEKKVDKIRKNNLALQKKRRELLIFAGYPEDYTNVKYHCSDCEDTGFTQFGECDCLKRELARITIESSGIGGLVTEQSFENFDLKYYATSQKEYESMKKNLDFLKTYVEKFNDSTSTSLLFVGATGLGKTHLSTAMATGIIYKGYDVIYDTAQNILSDFEDERFRKDNLNESKGYLTKKYFTCDLLIIDDLGTELTNTFTLSVLYNLINTRVNSKKPMIISTNLMSKELNQRYDQRITSRLLGAFEPILFHGKDIRMQKLN